MSKIEIQITDKELFDNRKLLPKETKEKWLRALRSGQFKKGKGFLRDENDNYCCLGVFCEINDIPKKISDKGNYKYNDYSSCLASANPFYNILSYFGNFQGFLIHTNDIGNDFISLAAINDNSYTFEYVIEVIEKYF